ncbi:2-oxoglutarate-dependent dioxygenase [Melia azedarach]|uniref:2-oxoglutarate-dependent dioxygenase n=1 Tax=Melia azedarach TaxID=155640 RepID=A0ACC1X9E8_MELAZ|nr:2-oxoglutarate-dependent dioxygenase [Melia azedarach]
MGSEAQMLHFDFSGDDERWKEMSAKIRDALETHGCFLVFYDKIPVRLREDMFMAMNTLFDLPEETKNKYVSPRPYRSYLGNSPIVPLHESFGIDNEPEIDAAQAFTNLMWPDGNPCFCETLRSMSSKMLELNHTILKMVFESFGVEKLYDSHKQGSTSVFRLMKYRPPIDKEAAAMGLVPHTDKNALTILCQNDVQGLQVLNNDGVYVPLMVPDNAFIVLIGDSLKAWSNGRLKAAKHRVVMSGEKERYSFGLFSMPKEGVITEVPNELVDEHHPLLYRPFKFTEFMSYFSGNISDDALEIYAGL